MDFTLYYFTFANEGARNSKNVYILAKNWPDAFNIVYRRFGDSITITEVRVAAVENSTFFASEYYMQHKMPTDVAVIDGVDLY